MVVTSARIVSAGAVSLRRVALKHERFDESDGRPRALSRSLGILPAVKSGRRQVLGTIERKLEIAPQVARNVTQLLELVVQIRWQEVSLRLENVGDS